MDKNSISVLQDNQKSIEESIRKIDSKINNFKKATKSEKKKIKNSLNIELENIKTNIKRMEAEQSIMKDQNNRETWEDIISKYKSTLKEYKKKIQNLEENLEEDQENGNHLDPDAKVDLNQLNVQQAIDRGNAIVKKDGEMISGMVKIVDGDVQVMKDANANLEQQKEKLDIVDNDLKEMEYSVDRARKKITSMFKLYASDKCITCLIVVILIIIVTIIIVSACGGDNKNNFNVPHDVFDTNKNETNKKVSNSAHCLIKTFHILHLLCLSLLYVF
jgi:DNA repair exonuclease SbcCD ATPase subunit